MNDNPSLTSDLAPRVRHLEGQMAALSSKIDDGFGQVFDKINNVAQSVAAMQAVKPQGWDKVLGFVKDAVILVGALATAIIYVARATSSADTGALREDLAVIKSRLAAMDQRPAPAAPEWPAQIVVSRPAARR